MDDRSDARVEFFRLSKSYGGKPAVRDLSFRVADGEVYALLGPNGAGKTTALRCLAGLLKPTSGMVRISGQDVASNPMLPRRSAGFLSSSMGLYDLLTAEETLRYFGNLHGMRGRRLNLRVEHLLDEFGILDFRNQYCGKLSTGQKQRVSIARSVVHDPKVLVLDEPTNGLDILSGQTVFEFIRRERARGKAIIFSTHHMDEVQLLAGRVGLLALGGLVAEGTIPDLIATAEARSLAEAFLTLVTREQAA